MSPSVRDPKFDPLFDRLVAEAWPAPYREEIGGWVLRYANGVTKRANSVLPYGDPGDVEAAIEGAERFYAARNLPTVFSIGQGTYPGLDGLLAARGYVVVDPSLVMTADIPDAADRIHDELVVDAGPSSEWLDVWWQVGGGRPDPIDDAKEILLGVAASYVLIRPGLAVGRGVPQGTWYGIYCMAVAPHARRRGLGGAVLRALFADGSSRGARRAYLVVGEANAAARALYERAGLQVAARYHYRVRYRTNA